MTLFFHYNANKFSLQNKKFAGICVAEIGCAYNEVNDTVYECAILDDVEQIFANTNVATILATLADHMYEWSDYKQVNSKTELMTLINKTLSARMTSDTFQLLFGKIESCKNNYYLEPSLLVVVPSNA